jgi:hypothetical protein
MIALFAIARRIADRSSIWRYRTTVLLGSLASIGAVALPTAWQLKLVLVLCTLLGFSVVAWLWTAEERAFTQILSLKKVAG